MKKKVIVLSLGGSLIIPDKINQTYLDQFKKTILPLTKQYKFVIVCGGGSVARDYIKGLEKTKQKKHLQSLMGIAATRLNARFMNYFFGQDPNKGIPHDMISIKNILKKRDIIFCGALRYANNQTSDATSAKVAHYFKTEFINLTDVEGLYTQNPKKVKHATLIKEIGWKQFEQKANESKFTPGQHFVLDQTAAKIIRKYKITTYILGKNLNQLKNVLEEKPFTGTKIYG